MPPRNGKIIGVRDYPTLEFTQEIKEKLNYYVYMLTDPREDDNNSKPFYVGKGKGNRVFDHVRAILKQPIDSSYQDICTDDSQDVRDAKIKTIKRIHAKGKLVGHIIIKHNFKDPKEALDIESALIGSIPKLTNKVGGYHNKDTCKSVEEITDLYANEIAEFDEKHKIILIKIHRKTYNTRGSWYDAVRWAWRISKIRTQQPHYVLAVESDIVREVFQVNQWQKANETNLQQQAKSLQPHLAISERLFFTGTKVDMPLYKDKLIPKEYRTGRGSQNPIRYTF